MMKYNNTQNVSLWAKTVSLLMVFAFAVGNVLALPGTSATNLQTTAGVTTNAVGSTLNITAPDKAVLTWQAFGSGADAIGLTDTLNYALPAKNSSVLNIVAGGASTTIDGSITSNGNVFVLNPNGIIVGGGARIDTNALYLGTSDVPAFASYYFQQNGRLPSQDGLSSLAGNTAVNTGAIIKVTDNITIASKNINVGGAFVQGNLILNGDGAVALGSSGFAYIDGNLSATNTTGGTLIGSAGNSVIVTGNITSTGGTTSTFATAPAAASIQTKSATINAGTVTSDKINTANLTVSGNNVTVNVTPAALNPVVSVTGNGNVSISAPSAATVNVTNTLDTGATNVTAAGALTLNKVSVAGAANFTGTSVSDTLERIFVYSNTSFNATAGNVTINKGKHSFGAVSVSAPLGEAVIYEDAATQLNVINTPKLTLRSPDYVFQTSGTGVLGSTNTIVTANGNITLGAAGNAAGTYVLTGNNINLANTGASVVTLTGGNIAVTSGGAITLNNVNAGGTLGLNAGTAISQAADTKVNAVGAVSLVGSGVTLNNAGNTFGALTIDVGLAGTAAVTEQTTLNLASLRAGTATFNSNGNVITTGILPVAADSFSIITAGDFIPAANFKAINPITVLSSGNVDLSALSSSTNLNNKSPSVIAKGYKAPTP